MQLWFSRHSDVSIREQLATQVVLAIVSGELAPGDRLPSTRELARRFHLHPNTVSAGYRQLQRSNWLEFRKGSGIYVRAEHPASQDALALDQLISNFFGCARQLNVPLATVRERLQHWLEIQPPDHFLLIESDAALARIIAAEMQAVLAMPVRVADLKGSSISTDGCVPVALSISAKAARTLLPQNADLISLDLRSARESLARYLPASNSFLVGIASGWPSFLKNARTMLTAAGFAPESLVLRDSSRPGWQRGLKQVVAVVCDTLTAELMDGMPRVVTFPLLAESSLQELKRYEAFIRRPLQA
ncbi:MAG TPA: GntR family transcriptional regulator [Terriglobales bacterium]|nr:GntR family transcriptional regulator [Terriglobales bacterium]